MSSSSSSAPTAKKGYQVGDLFLKPSAKYVGKLIHRVASSTAVPVLTSLTNSSPEDPYHFGKLTKQVASGVYKHVLKSSKLSVTAHKNPYKSAISPLDYTMRINRPYADDACFGLYRDIGINTIVFADSDIPTPVPKTVVIRDVMDDDIATCVYEDPVLSTKGSPHYAAAMIIGDRMLAIVWVDKTRYFVDTSSPCRLEDVYLACNCEEPKSSNCMTIQRI